MPSAALTKAACLKMFVCTVEAAAPVVQLGLPQEILDLVRIGATLNKPLLRHRGGVRLVRAHCGLN